MLPRVERAEDDVDLGRRRRLRVFHRDEPLAIRSDVVVLIEVSFEKHARLADNQLWTEPRASR